MAYKTFRQDLKDGSKYAVLTTLGTVAGVVFLILLATMWIFGWGFISQSSANFRGETSKRNLVEANGSFRIAAYDHFHDLCADIQATEDKIRIQRDELTMDPSPQRAEEIRINVIALESHRAEAIRQYNQDAHKSYTIGQFRSSDLPFQLDPTARSTKCTV